MTDGSANILPGVSIVVQHKGLHMQWYVQQTGLQMQ